MKLLKDFIPWNVMAKCAFEKHKSSKKYIKWIWEKGLKEVLLGETNSDRDY